MRRVGALICALAFLACGRDAYQVQWDDDFNAAVRRGREAPREAEQALALLGEVAPRAIDEGATYLERFRILRDIGAHLEGAELLMVWAEVAPLYSDRARAYYELAKLAEGYDRERAKALYRVIVKTYPTLMPAERSLAHLLRMARSEGIEAVDAHLAWTRSIRGQVAHTSLRPHLVWQAADEAHRRAQESGSEADWARAKQLFQEVMRDHESHFWDDAHWDLSWRLHDEGDYEGEIRLIRKIQATRETDSFFGQNEHVYYFDGQLRIARLYLEQLGRPEAAAAAYLEYLELFPKTRLRDDVRFYAMCAYLRMGSPKAEEMARLLHRDDPESRFLRRIPEAQADPYAGQCVPPEVRP